MTEEHTSLNQLIAFRKEKLEKLRANGVNPYPYSYDTTHTSQAILNDFSGQHHLR